MAKRSKTTLRELAMYYEEPQVGEKFPLMQSKNKQEAWWLKDNAQKVHLLAAAFKNGSTMQMACYQAGITESQLYRFREAHPWFDSLVKMYRELPAAKLKEIVLRESIGDPSRGIKPNPKIALGALKYFHVAESDPVYANTPVGEDEQYVAKRSYTERIRDEKGVVRVSRETQEYVRKHGLDSNK